MPVEPCFIAKDLAELEAERWVEGGRAGDRRWQCGRFRLVAAVAASHSRAPVDHANGRDPEFRNTLDVSADLRERTTGGPIRSALRWPRVVRNLLNLLFQGHLCDQQVGPLLWRESGVHPWQSGTDRPRNAALLSCDSTLTSCDREAPSRYDNALQRTQTGKHNNHRHRFQCPRHAVPLFPRGLSRPRIATSARFRFNMVSRINRADATCTHRATVHGVWIGVF